MLDQQNPKSLNLSVINHSDLEVHNIVMTNKNVEERDVQEQFRSSLRAGCSVVIQEQE